MKPGPRVGGTVPSGNFRVFVSCLLPASVRRAIADAFEASFNESDRVLPRDELLAHAIGMDALLVTATDRVDADVIARMPPSVRAIATYSVGLDHIDVAAARARCIRVLNTPDVLTNAVAEIAMLLMLGAARRATESIALIRGGTWQGWTPVQLLGVELHGRTLGIFGMGRIGRAVARRAAAFGMRVHYSDVQRLDGDAKGDAVFHADVEDMLPNVDVLLLACPATPETRRFLDVRRIALLRPSTLVVNISRGSVVDDEALIAALSEGRLRAAGLDVFDGEPHVHPGYFALPNVFMLPHIGSSTEETRERMGTLLVDGLAALACGVEPSNSVA